MSADLRGKVALVSGGASGLGEATCRVLAARGATVIVLDAWAERGREVASSIGGHFVEGSVDERAAIEVAVRRAAELGSLRIVVSCAGVPGPVSLFERDMLTEFEQVLRTNLIGTVALIGAAAAIMKELPVEDEERGVIVFTSSRAAHAGERGQCAYAASKAALEGFLRPAAIELGDVGIRLVGIAPGLFETGFTAMLDERQLDELRSRALHPKRGGAPHEFARLVEHVVDNRFLNAAVLRIDGGF